MQVWFNYADQILILLVFALSLNLLLGYAGQVSAASAALGAVGGYAVGYLTIGSSTYCVDCGGHDWGFLPALVVGVVAATVIGIALALPALRLSAEYLVLLTLAASLVIIGVIQTFFVLGGSYGLSGIPEPDIFGYRLDEPSDWVAPLLVVVVVVYLVCRRLGESPYGRVLKGLRENPDATRSLGKNVFAYKVSVFAVTSAMAGLAGGLYAGYLQLASPMVYGFDTTLEIFAIVILGGTANLAGSVLGATVLVAIEPLLERQPFVDFDARTASLLQLIIYGGLLVAFMLWRPQGVLPEGFSLRRWLRGERGARRRVEMSPVGWVPDVDAATTEISAHRSEEDRERAWQEADIVLQVRGLSKRFGGIIAADNLDLVLRRGTITALVGPNGAGKTTVFNLLTGFIRPNSGSVLLNGAELLGRTPEQVARRGMVRSFQDVQIVARLSCLQNVMLGVKDQVGERMAKLFVAPRRADDGELRTRERAFHWLEFVGMANFADVPAGSLSFGQSKLVALARILATEAEVLLLDEPASGIDPKWLDTMLDLVEAVRLQGRTVCIIEHNLRVVGHLADHTYFMELGRITAEGTITELTSSQRLTEAYFGAAG